MRDGWLYEEEKKRLVALFGGVGIGFASGLFTGVLIA